MRTAVITLTHRRSAHLRNQRTGLTRGGRPTDMHVIVAMDDPAVRDDLDDGGPPAIVVDCATAQDALPLARARNAGAAAAIEAGAELLIFLDVDCIPGCDLVNRYHSAASQSPHADALLCGPVTYLPPPGEQGYPVDRLHELVRPHPARPAPVGHQIIVGADYRLFWSLSFAVRPSTWQRIGGFCEEYRGYGGEDTVFAQCAATRGVSMRWIGGADAFHQYHPVSDPPVEHLGDILRNAVVFHRRWGWWPMEGWLRSFASLGLIDRDGDGTPHRVHTGGWTAAPRGIPAS